LLELTVSRAIGGGLAIFRSGLQYFDNRGNALQKPSKRQWQIFPIHAVHCVFYAQSEFGIAFDPNPALEKQRVRILR
jgi:hypothetical protein